jgi:hypothetical protein
MLSTKKEMQIFSSFDFINNINRFSSYIRKRSRPFLSIFLAPQRSYRAKSVFLWPWHPPIRGLGPGNGSLLVGRWCFVTWYPFGEVCPSVVETFNYLFTIFFLQRTGVQIGEISQQKGAKTPMMRFLQVFISFVK